MKADLEQPEERDPSATTESSTGIEERWLRITEIVGAAWEMSASLREAYVSERCREDDSMRQEVEKLLRQLADSSGLLQSDSPAVADLKAPGIAPGTLLGRYRIQEKIGEGGMGVVYRAVDERLERIVALKVLRFLTIDPQFRDRLLREAQMTAALSHPNIVTVYDTGSSGIVDFIAMEYVNGATLDQVISRAPLSLGNALRYAQQIASALAKAHSAGIVHRDLKPGNVILAEDGSIKVLDFGLAKRLEARLDPALMKLNFSSTKRAQADLNQTGQGTVLGTVAYMSPEQARGDTVDERSDIFSFGAILFELLSGRKAFRGASQAEILDAIRRGRAPSLRDSAHGVPKAIDKLVSQCMQKEPEGRPRAKEIAANLQALGKGRRTKTWVAAVAILAAIAAGSLTLVLKKPHQVTGKELLARPLTFDPGDEISCSFSPEGKQIVFSWRREDENAFNLYRMPVTGGKAQRLTNSSFDDFSPVWSPDGREIAFIRGRAGQPGSIQLIPAGGGAPRKVVQLSSTPWIFSRELDSSPDGKWLAFADEDPGNGGWSLFTVAPQTGVRHKLAQPPRGFHYLQPVFSPDGTKLAFTDDHDGVSQLRLLRLKRDATPDGPSWPVRLRGFRNAICNTPMWFDSGRKLLFSSNKNGAGGQLWTVDIRDSETRALVPEMAGSLGEGALLPAISRSAHYLGFARLSEDKNIWRVNLSGPENGQLTRLIDSTRQENFPEYSPDGRKIAFESDRSGFPEIWVSNADGTGAFALTDFEGPVTGSPSWSPDSSQIAFDSRTAGAPEIFVIRATAGSKPRRLTYGGGENILPCWSADGRFVFFTSNRTGSDLVWRVPEQGGRPEQVTNTFAFAPKTSPDGKYLYFMGAQAGGSIHQFNLATRRETGVVAVANERSFSVTSRGVYYLREVSARAELLHFWDARRKQDSVLARITGRFAGGLSVSQDDRFALFVKDDRGGVDLMLVEDFN